MAYTVYYDTPGTVLTYSQMQSALAALASANSWTYQTFGQSENERDIDGVIINPTGSITVLLNGAIHGIERPPARAALDLLNYFAATPSALIPGVRYIVIPILNPDGWVKNSRKNDNDYADDGLVPWPRYVDINRNFPIGWDAASSDPANASYRGPSALSEAESQVVEDIFDAYGINYHIDTHTTTNEIGSSAGYYAYHYPAIVAALTANEFEVFPSMSSTPTPYGTIRDYGFWARGAETYTVELRDDTAINEEVNRYICLVLAAVESFVENKHNVFKNDPTCVAHYRFNALSGLTTDEMGLNDLANQGGVGVDTTNFAEGDASAYLTPATSKYFYRADSILSAGFPLKSGTTNKKMGFFSRFRMDALPANGVNKAIISKYQSSGNARSFVVLVNNDNGTYRLRLWFGYNNGVSVEGITVFNISPSAGEWYAVAGGFDDADKSWYVEWWDDTQRLDYASGNYTNAISLTTARLDLGAAEVGSPYYQLGGNLDETVIFTEIPSPTKIADIWAGEYGFPEIPTLADSTSSSTGTVAISGALSQTLSGSTISAAGNVPIVGALSQTLASATLSASTSSGLSGALASTLANASIASTGTAAIAGSLSASLASSTVAATGAVPIVGVLASTLADSALSSSSSTASVGALASTLQSATVSASGVVPVSGSLSATLADATLSAYFGDSTPAQLSATLASATVAATGEVAVMAALSAALQDAFAASAGEVDIDAECAAILADCTGVIAGRVAIVGSGSATLASATLSARAGANLVPDALPSRMIRVARENRISRVARENRIVRA